MTVLAAWDWHRFTKFDVWGVLFWLNTIVLLSLAIAIVVALTRDRAEKAAPNLTPFLEDEDLEGRRLERVLGWALLFSAVLAVSYGIYWLREPTRQFDSERYFDEGAIERGEELFANAQFEVYNAAKSLSCADCHGSPAEDALLEREVVADGGSAPFTYRDADGTAFTVSWSAPALNTVMYRFSPDEVREIIVYGRQGTPMQAWGTEGGGPKNDQSIDDLVAYLASIQLSPEEAQRKTAQRLEVARAQAEQQLTTAEEAVTTAEEALEAAEAELADLADTTNDDDPERVKAQRKVDAARAKLEVAEARLEWSQEWNERRGGVTDGQLLFELNCARCHTKNWSIFDPANTKLPPEDLLGPPGGGGQTGFNLRDGQILRRFANTLDADGNPVAGSGRDAQRTFVGNGSEYKRPYGTGGIGSGSMPGQCNSDFAGDFDILEHSGCMLTEDQIAAIVQFERCGLDATSNDLAVVEYDDENADC
jgi:mono/diheme cytochrome c family protein